MHLIFTLSILCMCKGLFETISDMILKETWGIHIKITGKNIVKMGPPHGPTVLSFDFVVPQIVR